MAAGETATEMQHRVIELGWSRAFAAWYAVQLQTEGDYLEIRVPSEPGYVRELSQHRDAMTEKSRLIATGLGLVAAGILLPGLAIVLILTSLSSDPSTGPLMMTLLFAAYLSLPVMWLVGWAKVAQLGALRGSDT